MHIVIIGNGISGITAARHIRKLSDHKITVISSETDHFFSRTALMYIYMGHMKYENTKPYEDYFWEKNRIDLLRAFVEKVDFEAKELHLAGSNQKMSYDKLVLAVGSKPNKFGWKGQDLLGVQGLYSYQDLQTMEIYTKDIDRAVIVGGGLIGIEMAEMLLSRNINVSFLVRENAFWNNVLPKEEAEMIVRHIKEHHIDLRLETELKEILPDENGRVKAVLTNKEEEIPCQFVGLTPGVSPNIAFLKNTKLEIQRGILVNHFLETNMENVYALGDCAEFREPIGQRRSLEQVWYTGKMMGETLARTICEKPTKYQPGNWFNSAKFLDIEYQTYGWVWSKLKKNEADFYWEDSKRKRSFRAVWDKEKGNLLGINVFGIRFRHEVCDQWLTEKKPIDEVISELPKANFDPEFFNKPEKQILKAYNKKFGKNLKLNR